MIIRIFFILFITICFSSFVLILHQYAEAETFKDVLYILIFIQTVLGYSLIKLSLEFIVGKEMQTLRLFISNLCNGQYQQRLKVPLQKEDEPYLIRTKRDLNSLAAILDNYKQKNQELYAQERQRTRQYKEAAYTDKLTNIPNRHGYERELAARVECLKQGKSFYLILIDLDNFKHVNDTYGHKAGDDILRLMGKCLQENIRQKDFPFRFGGDEFGIFMDECPPENAFTVAKRIQDCFSQNEIGVGSSFGGKLYTPETKLTAKEIFSQADEALYAAKKCKHLQNGKNIIIND